MAETGTQVNNRIRRGLGLTPVEIGVPTPPPQARNTPWLGNVTAPNTNNAAKPKETLSQANARILGNLGLDTALTPKKKKKPETVLSAQTEIVNRLGE